MQKFVIYGRPGCQWCEKAINFLVARGQTIEYVNVRANDENMDRFRRYHPDADKVPQIEYWPYAGSTYIHIGGFTDLRTWYGDKNAEGSDI